VNPIVNPILRGFNPDPSILRVEDDYYIATSTFEWFPGVQIHHSRDLIHWKLIGRALNRVSQLDLRGVPSSGGVWAPCLTYDNGTFFLAYTIVFNHDGIFWNVKNFLVTARSILGPWSEPVFLNSEGFDPSLFHDDDGRKWLVQNVGDFRGHGGSIAVQEYSLLEGRLLDKPVTIYQKSQFGDPEGPHLYKRNGLYFLVVAEGGTGLGHAVVVSRAPAVLGPYELDPEFPTLTSRGDMMLELQKAGHGSLVETQKGEWYMAHLCARPLPTRGVCPLGRETALQKMIWDSDGWPRLATGGNKPLVLVPAPDLPEQHDVPEPSRVTFATDKLNVHFQSLRVPLDERALSLTERPGFLRLKGQESLDSQFYQSLVARRQQSFCFAASTVVEFEPVSFKQMAGLVCYYSTLGFHYLKVSHDERSGKSLEILTRDNDQFQWHLKEHVDVDGWSRIYLRAEVNYDHLQFFYGKTDGDWTKIGPILDASILSDEHIAGWAFTGAFVGLACQDLTGRGLPADFEFFDYAETEPATTRGLATGRTH